MPTPRLVGAFTLLLGLSGCGAALEHWENQNNFLVAADDLDPTLTSDPQYAKFAQNYANPMNLSPDQRKEYLGLVVGDSEFKCGKFLNGLVLAENSSNSSLDIMTTIFSALGTAFTPVSTIHALTAGATITSGTKTAINSDIYAKATIGNYAQAIQASYYTEINAYLTALNESNADNLIVSVELDKIRSIHKDCSLASAQSTISATLTPAVQQTVATATDVWMVAKTLTQGARFSLIATLPGGTVTLPITVETTKPADLATAIVGKVNANADLQKAGVTAAVEADGTTIDLRAPAAANVAWRVDPASETALQHRGASAATVAPAPGATLLKATPSGVLTHGAVPGSALK